MQTRKLWILEGEKVDYIHEATAFPGIGLILRVDTEVRVGEPRPARRPATRSPAGRPRRSAPSGWCAAIGASRTDCTSSKIAGGTRTVSRAPGRAGPSGWPCCVTRR